MPRRGFVIDRAAWPVWRAARHDSVVTMRYRKLRASAGRHSSLQFLAHKRLCRRPRLTGQSSRHGSSSSARDEPVRTLCVGGMCRPIVSVSKPTHQLHGYCTNSDLLEPVNSLSTDEPHSSCHVAERRQPRANLACSLQYLRTSALHR